jgi:hypothetical protein
MPDRVKRLEESEGKLPFNYFAFKLPNHPDNGELPHNKYTEKVANQLNWF